MTNQFLKRLNADILKELKLNQSAFQGTIAEVRPQMKPPSMDEQANTFLNLDTPTRAALATQMDPQAYQDHVDKMISHAATMGIDPQNLYSYFSGEGQPQPDPTQINPDEQLASIEQELNRIIDSTKSSQ
jgi:hypothetical protein